MFRFYTVPEFIRKVYSTYQWNVKTNDKIIYLTFDDGPIPEVTDFVLNELEKYKAKATFFCVGDNIIKHSEIFKKVLEHGHSFGNHTQNHVKGWQLKNADYMDNIMKFNTSVQEVAQMKPTLLFRPPYGRIKSSQGKMLTDKYKIIMWEVLTCDYDKTLNPDTCLKEAIRNTKNGSIVLFHDSLKAEKNLKHVLPRYLNHFSTLGYQFESLKPQLF